MGTRPDPFAVLREALRLTPDNVPLRLHLAESLLRAGLADEAEYELRAGLKLTPHDPRLSFGLAKAYFDQGKRSQALVVAESLANAEEPQAAALVLYARLLADEGDLPRARARYRQAIEIDPEVADADLAARLEAKPTWGEGSRPRGFEGRVPADSPLAMDSPSSLVEIERPGIQFSDVGGMEQVKEDVRLKIIYPLQHAEMYRAYGKAIGGGILLYGPPGCGKTHLARATAGEIQGGFLIVGITDVLDMWLGNSERNLHELFEAARRNTPCVMFFDEVDALGASRSDMRQSSSRHLINQFLAEMDGAKSSNDGVLILGATNAPWHLDSAFRRPGRFDQIVFVPPPDLAARAEILRLHLRGKPNDGLDVELVARKTEHFSGADLKAVVDRAVESKLKEAMRSGGLKPLGTRDLLAAATATKPSTKEWFATARNHALYANQGGIYDDILKYLKL